MTSLLKKSLRENNLLRLEANSFLIEKAAFQKGTETILIGLSPLKVYQFSLNVQGQNMDLMDCNALTRIYAVWSEMMQSAGA